MTRHSLTVFAAPEAKSFMEPCNAYAIILSELSFAQSGYSRQLSSVPALADACGAT
ncbi:hypothetical protein OKW37_003278 [Paraburkholderia sp. MM5482-R2]